MVGYVDRDLRVRSANRFVCVFYGRPREQILGRTLPEIVGPEIFARLRPGLETALSGQSATFDDVAPDWYGPGLHGVSEEHYNPRFGPDGAVVGIDLLSIGVPNRWRAEIPECALCRKVLVAQEEERRALARELHEEISQSLSGLDLWLSTAEAPDPRLDEARRLISGLTERTRRLAIDLRPPELDDFNLLVVLRAHLRRFEQRTGIRAQLHALGGGYYFPDPVQTVAFRIEEEALTNAERHAGVSQIIIEISVERAVLTVTIRDTGAGFDPGAVAPGRGLGSMRAWAELVGGALDVRAIPSEGVSITAKLPLS